MIYQTWGQPNAPEVLCSGPNTELDLKSSQPQTAGGERLALPEARV